MLIKLDALSLSTDSLVRDLISRLRKSRQESFTMEEIKRQSINPRRVFFFPADDGIRDRNVTGVQTCALPISSMYAVHATAPASSIWLQPSADRARPERRASSDPTALPPPKPTRNTARIIEKVYTVAPSISPSRRVQITSAPSAQAPERAMAA